MLFASFLPPSQKEESLVTVRQLWEPAEPTPRAKSYHARATLFVSFSVANNLNALTNDQRYPLILPATEILLAATQPRCS